MMILGRYSTNRRSRPSVFESRYLRAGINKTFKCKLERTRPFDQNLSKIHKIVNNNSPVHAQISSR